MDYKGKKLLVLAGANIHNKVVEAAKEMGIYTIVTDYLPDSPAKKFDVDELAEWGKQNKINGVLGFCCDPTSKPAQEIADRLDLPAFGTEQQVLALTKKPYFKQLCLENQVDIIPTYTEQDVAEGKAEYPLLIKPTDSRGSRGISICESKEDVAQAIKAAKCESSDGKIIIEKYMKDCQDLTISYIIKDGIPTLISIGDRYSGKVEDNLDRQLICTIQPSRYARMYMENVNDRVVNMIKNLGIKNGPVFMQGFVDGDTVRMYDPGIRFPGNEYERIYREATGIDPMKSIISYCVGGEILDYSGKIEGSYNLNGMCAIQYMINVGPGKIAEFCGLKEIAGHKNVVDVQQKHFVGDIIEQTGDVQHRAGEISILVERDLDKMADLIRYVQDNLGVRSDKGENMLISPFNPERIYQIYGEQR